MPSTKRELNGPRPSTLNVEKASWEIKKPTPAIDHRPHHRQIQRQFQMRSPDPVVVYFDTPKIVHATPHEFRALVQRLTGKSPSDPSSSSSSSSSSAAAAAAAAAAASSSAIGATRGDCGGSDPLILTLGQCSGGSVPSPVSPGLFLCSPNTVQTLQEFSSLF